MEHHDKNRLARDIVRLFCVVGVDESPSAERLYWAKIRVNTSPDAAHLSGLINYSAVGPQQARTNLLRSIRQEM